MQTFARLNPHGVPETFSTARAEGMVEVPEGVDPQTSMCPSGTWLDRPAVEARAYPDTLVLTRIPPGTRLEVVDVAIGAIIVETVLDGDETLSFPEAGTYQVEVCPPMPWRGWSGVLTC